MYDRGSLTMICGCPWDADIANLRLLANAAADRLPLMQIAGESRPPLAVSTLPRELARL